MTYNFGNTIKNLRKQRGLTQEQTAEFFGVSAQAISKWETNMSYPDITLLPIIAAFFGVSTDELLGVDIGKRDQIITQFCEKAAALCEESNYAEAVALLRGALLQYPGNDKLMYHLAWALTGTIREHRENLDEAINIYYKILEISTDTELRAKVTRDLVYRYATKNDIATALRHAEMLPCFEVCREYTIGRGNLLEGKALAAYLQNNIQLFGNAVLECLKYFQDHKILSEEEMTPYTPEDTKKKIALLKEILT